MKACTIPTRLVAPFVREYLDRENAIRPTDSDTFVTPLTELSTESKVSKWTISRIVHERCETVTLRTADRLLCAVIGPHVWMLEPLSAYYGATA